jgi:ketosteroid isomerase-like protein
MDRSLYDRYLTAFNDRDYDAVLAFYAEPFELTFAGYRFTRKAQVKAFYQFFHAYVNESITVTAYVGDARMVALEARVRLQGIRDLDAETLAAAGFGRLVPLAVGQVVEMAQFIHYHLRDGKIVRVACVVV